MVYIHAGYLHITDFGIARFWNPENSSDTSGTPGYMAPEVMCKQNHGVTADYFAIGIIAYECMMGKVCWSYRDHIWGKLEEKSETKYLQGKR